MWHTAKPENKKRIGGIMLAAALTSFLTGITEPIEFSFLFIAPILYAAHALIAGFSFFVCIALEIKHGTTFSHGLIDFIVLYPKSSNAWMIWILGPIWAVMYFGVFTYIIKKFNLKTPGREDATSESLNENHSTVDTKTDRFSQDLALALGGSNNIKTLDSCITRLRVQLNSTENIKAETFKKLGATNSIIMGNGVQVIFGPRSENIKNQLEQYLKNPQLKATTDQKSSPSVYNKSVKIHDSQMIQLFGGGENISDSLLISNSRLQIKVTEKNSVKIDELKDLFEKNNLMIENFESNVFHIIAGQNIQNLNRFYSV